MRVCSTAAGGVSLRVIGLEYCWYWYFLKYVLYLGIIKKHTNTDRLFVVGRRIRR